jgi:hypothetical protein
MIGLLIGVVAIATPHVTYACSSGAVQVSHSFDNLPGVTTDGSGNDCIGGNGVNPIYAFISILLTFAVGVLGLLMVLMIVIAGLQYVVSNGDPSVTKAAKDRIRNVITGFVLFVLMYGILQILLPPGSSVFKP